MNKQETWNIKTVGNGQEKNEIVINEFENK